MDTNSIENKDSQPQVQSPVREAVAEAVSRPDGVVRVASEGKYGYGPAIEPEKSLWSRVRAYLIPIGTVLLVGFKFLAKLKFLIIPVLKFFPVLLKTGGTMFLTIWIYSLQWGWVFALGFVVLILVHECGHLLAARRVGLKVGAPVFIPFMGAFIALKEAPRNAWIEAQVGYGGPFLGTLGSCVCAGIYYYTGHQLFQALAYVGFMLNLFNLIPIGFLDGGRIVTAISPWFWIVGMALGVVLVIFHPNVILFIILILAIPKIWSFFFSKKTEEQERYYEVSVWRRVLMAFLYFGLLIFLVVGMKMMTGNTQGS